MQEIDPFYPHHSDYYVAEATHDEFPVRQGDVMSPPQFLCNSIDPWIACQIIHPSCEINAKKNPQYLQVVRVNALEILTAAKDQAEVVRGHTVANEGAPRIAWAHTFFLPPTGQLTVPMFSDFRQTALVHRDELLSLSRQGAMSHDARVYFIRRKLYWEQRWLVTLGDVRRLESMRIGGDPNFVGQKPSWASA